MRVVEGAQRWLCEKASESERVPTLRGVGNGAGARVSTGMGGMALRQRTSWAHLLALARNGGDFISRGASRMNEFPH